MPNKRVFRVISNLSKGPSGGSGGGGGGGGGSAVIVNIGGENAPAPEFVEYLRRLVTNVTDFDIDDAFNPKQQEIILKAIRGLADSPEFAERMADLISKGADINIIADFRGDNTNGNRGVTLGKDDGKVDRGESITIYINMKSGSEPISNQSLANTIVHELLHVLGDAQLDSVLDAPGSTYDRGPTRDIFSHYDFLAPAGSQQLDAEIISVPSGGGLVTGSSDFAIYNGSDFSDRIVTGSGGGLIYSGGGDDHLVLTAGARLSELVDSGGSDTIELGAGVAVSDVSLRWWSDGYNLSIIVNGSNVATVIGATGAGAIENLSIAGNSYDLSSLSQTSNHAPVANQYEATYEGSFFGGYLGDGSASDVDQDIVSYRLEGVLGEYADAMWSVDPVTGAVSGNFSRMATDDTSYSYVTISASDGIETTFSSLTIRWGDSFEYPMPNAVPEPNGERVPLMIMDTPILYGDQGMVYV